MILGTILHQKYIRGISESPANKMYCDQAIKIFSHFGMFGTGMFKAVAPHMPTDENDYNWEKVDILVDFAIKGNSQIHYNTVITGRIEAFPDWFKELNQEERCEIIEKHVRNVVRRYKGKVEFFKLVNEAILEPDENYLGTGKNKADFIADIFKWAVEEYPEGKFMLNEYGTLIRNEIREPFMHFIEAIKEKGGRIDLIGLQGHMGYFPLLFKLPPIGYLSNALDEIHNSCNCPIVITEYDLTYDNRISSDLNRNFIDPALPFEAEGSKYKTWYDYQADAYKKFVELCEGKRYVDGFYCWMFADDRELAWERFGCGILNEKMEIKPAFLRVLENRIGK